MIHSLTIRNFLSFREDVTFSFEASKDKTFEDHHVIEVAKGVRLLKLGILYGYNASGKSNLIVAFQFLRNFWFSIADKKDAPTEVIPFLLNKNSRNEPSEFKITFYKDINKYAYTLKINSEAVLLEKLEFYPGTQPAVVFERKYDNENKVSNISFKGKFKVSKIVEEEITLKCLRNMSVFAALSQVNTFIDGLSDVSDWLRDHIFPVIDPNIIVQNFTENMVKENSAHKQLVLKCLKEADFNITGINVEEIVKPVTDDFINQAQVIGNIAGIPAIELERLKKERNTKYPKTEFEHSVTNNGKEETHWLPIHLQSEGTRRVFGLFGALIDTIEENAFLAIDEIESKLHPRLIEYVIEHFLRNSKQAQLLVTTHYDNLFDEDDLLRKDNFWFTEKGKDGSTKLYPLVSFNGINRISSLQKAYKFGKFGAVPNID
ncbi:MAG: ATP-binding protein [Candidatus Delongbacteria bacterium]